MDYIYGFPRQQLSYKKKTKEWAKGCVDWAANKHYFDYAPIRKSVVHMKINYDLINGRIHMDDVAGLLNPDNASTMFRPDKIQHYPIMNAYLNNLRGEASARVFDWKAIVTNPNSVSEIEDNKKQELLQAIQGVIEDQTIDDTEAQAQVQKISDYFTYEWQDFREIRANEIIKHYSKEQNFKGMFLEGFMDECISAVEAYQVGIVGGEPVLRRLNPMKLRVYMSGYSNHIEDADVIVYDDYMSPGQIIDRWYDQLKPKDIQWLEGGGGSPDGLGPRGAAGNYDDAFGVVSSDDIVGEDGVWFDKDGLGYILDECAELPGGVGSDLMPYDIAGNIRVTQVFWKSRRKIKKVKHYDPETGDELFDFYPENYIIDEDAGEEEEIFWVNEPWEGTRIGKDIYVNMRPMVVRSNSLDNPSKCNFGIIGTIYNLNEGRPWSLVDMMKSYNYLYDAIHAKLVELIATNWGKLLEMDLAAKPKDWEVEKWMYFARVNKVLIRDSFREGDYGASRGKLVAGLNNASKGVIDADWGNSIQNYLGMLDAIDTRMAKLIGMTPQRMGQIQNRETVGGVERATLQSSYITDYLFQQHDDTIRRVLTAFLEQAKASFRGRTKKFRNIMSDNSIKMMEIDGDEFAESDYGIVIDSSNDTQKLDAQLDALAQAAVQNQVMDFSSIMRLYTSMSISEKIRLVENAEKKMQQRQEQMQQQQAQIQQQIEQMRQQTELQKMQHEDALNIRDNDTRIKVAEINSRAEYMRLGIYAEENDEELVKAKQELERQKLAEQIKEFDAELRMKDKELDQKKEIELKKIEASKVKAKASSSGSSK